ncbi:ubiquitin-like-conjugating enzyme ATG10 isoform X3 [Ovis aries]|uniref:ubiquitin-like-conjugating enzyme ATG10 isoform X3 n=1 Tax=Ovis aries TaxID=9940 RepID=UPI00295279F9|nr:ubiquitin-like-conjugating enzyme ATG10 isoform X3 [Ovis aries]
MIVMKPRFKTRGLKEAVDPPLDDFEVTETTTAAEVIKYEYHVLYSCSYQVPVLYFRASFLDGRPLALKDIWEGVHECYKMRLLQGPWDTITQQEHPILGQPFFVLHPCKTSEFLIPVLKNSRKINRNVNYITSWLSMVGPAVGLNLPLSYATAASQEEGNVSGQGKKRSLHSTFPVAEILGLFCIWLCPPCWTQHFLSLLSPLTGH